MLLACNIFSTQLDIGHQSVSYNTIIEGQSKILPDMNLFSHFWMGEAAQLAVCLPCSFIQILS